MLAVDIAPVRLEGWRAVVKRAFDITLASLLLVVMSPVMGAIAIAVRATSPGPVLFGHERVTKNGRVFKMWKFRTMVQDADRILEQIKVSASTAFFKLEDDPRLTKLGRMLRRCSLDELPQLWNVVRGDMSLVGPRPLPVEQVKANEDFLGYRHDLPAGITGWWQINGRSELQAEEAVRLDHFYIDNWSLGLDLLILWKTARVVLKRSGAA
jgi:exopolysaccharide biosynthesis polyprenyl glycosylphosphotransferase